MITTEMYIGQGLKRDAVDPRLTRVLRETKLRYQRVPRTIHMHTVIAMAEGGGTGEQSNEDIGGARKIENRMGIRWWHGERDRKGTEGP
jgi:hypothetical protein